MSYAVNEIYYTVQGEGAHTGRPAVFCRFAGCNLWSGREEDRDRAVCKFCDTQFVGTDGGLGGVYPTANDLVTMITSLWPDSPSGSSHVFVVFTGGEPLLQLDAPLIDACHRLNVEIAVETNGTIAPPQGIDWVCVSPKAGAPFVARTGNELKIVYPQAGLNPADFEDLHFAHFFLQPMDGSDREENTRRTLEYCREHPRWRVSLQTHKLLGIP